MPQVLGKDVGTIGFGLMGLTWRATPPPPEQAFEAMRAALVNGMNYWNAAEFYGTPEYNSLTLLERYFEKYPEDADKVVLGVKGAVGLNASGPDGSPEEIRRSIDNCLRILKGRKKIDVFEPARRDKKVPLEITFAAINEYVEKGLVGGVGISEVAAATIHEAAKITKIVSVEVELSLMATDILDNGVVAACAEHDIPVIAYSPLGRGMFTTQFKSHADIPKDSFLQHFPRFSPENFDNNMKLVKQVEELASKKGCTPAQLAISWTANLSRRRPGLPTIIPIPGATTASRVNENAVYVELSDAEMAEIDETLSKFEVVGRRYPEQMPIET
ncbi:NADP-dependent oxidoreductase domain-containing protein [Apodospora peruviana]|uniref:NADP-dependent oxidoreductase domain-containing protein n=1 Tax=Apodospora peruviana TaxID=516989 RepID=A0AAE0IQD7_9PEZI|nr:NADP-dependent oxidoreductase domain-containing protein [Apodospora peruviana]